MPLIDQFAIQLYSVRDVIENDFTGTLKKLAAMGYTGVEFAGYGVLSAREMKDLLESLKLKPIGSHINLERLTKNLDEEIAYHKVLGTEYLICPYSAIKSEDDTLELAKTLKPVIAKISDAGFKFAYHNHAHEFAESDGAINGGAINGGEEYLLDILFENLPPQAAMELDVFWAAHAGVEPESYMEKHKDRLKLLHVKQIDKDKHCVDLDQGILDFKEIITKAKLQGVEHFILEQEAYAVSSMVSVKNDIDYIMSLEE
jgi:sugar phosphate isomerase/epimerase